MMTDPIADMLTRIRNANRIERPNVDMPVTKVKIHVAKVLKDEGFVIDFEVGKLAAGESGQPAFKAEPSARGKDAILRVWLKYGPEGERVIRRIERLSRPGRRLYQSYQDLRPVLDGLGISIISTSRGVMSDRQARKQRVGGEILCNVW